MGYNTYVKNGKEYALPKLVCNNQIHCRSGSVDFYEVLRYICNTLEDCIADFEIRLESNQDNSAKLHKSLVDNLEKKLKSLESKELAQWEAQYDPDPDKRLPQHIFKQLNEKLLLEKEEINKALCKAKETMPQPVDYKERLVKFTDALSYLRDPEVPAKLKNRYLKDIIERIDYDRPPTIRITSENAHLYPKQTGQGLKYHTEPYKLNIVLRS